MFRLAHISDIHLGPLPEVTRRELFSKRITGYVNFRRNRSSTHQPEITANLIQYLKTLAPDHTAITGDLINLGLPQEIETAKNWLEQLGDSKDQSVVLGNHDAYVRGARDRALEAWQPWVNGDDQKLVQSDAEYPVVRRCEEVSIICCNSARASAPFLATGYFKKRQALALKQILTEEKSDNQCCVVLIHHPPTVKATHRHKRLLGAQHFRAVIAEMGADLILHGHTHLKTLEYLDGPAAKVPVVCVPAAYQWTGHKKPPAGLNVFSISRSNNRWKIKLQRHGLTKDGTFEAEGKQTL